MAKLETWDDLPTRGQIKKRIDTFLRAFHDGKIEAAFAICPAIVWTEQGMAVKPGLSKDKLLEHLSHAVFQFLEEEVDGAALEDVEKWCKVITPPSEVDYEDIALEVPGTDSDADDDRAKATQEGEVLAVGPGARDDSGKLIDLEVRVGDRIFFGRWSGTEIRLDGQDLLIMKESDVMGVIEQSAEMKEAA